MSSIRLWSEHVTLQPITTKMQQPQYACDAGPLTPCLPCADTVPTLGGPERLRRSASRQPLGPVRVSSGPRSTLAHQRRCRTPPPFSFVVREQYRMQFTSGLPSLDNAVQHFAEGNLITVAGARAEEASVLVVNILRHMVLRLGARTLVLLPGQKTDAFEARLRGCSTGVPHQAVNDKKLTDEQEDAIARYESDRMDAPLVVANPLRVAVDELDDAVERYGELDLIVVDSVQLLDGPDLGEDEWGTPRTESRIASLSRASRALKHLAVKNQATVIAVCRRMSRYTSEAEKARGLAENSAAAFEAFLQDSDLVLELYPAKSARTVEDTRRVVLVRKNRWGPDGGWVPLGMEHGTSTVIDSGSRKRRR
jgi:replicative DNA helicase